MDVYEICYSLILICELIVLYCKCQTITLTPVDPEVIEGNDFTLVCTVSSTATYINWKLDVNSATTYTAMGVQNGACALLPPTSYLSDITKYSYDCNNTVYLVTVKNVQRKEHYNKWSCLSQGQSFGPETTMKVQVPVSSVSITPIQSLVDAIENIAVVFTCQTTAVRPDASVTWYMVESGLTSQINQNFTSSTTNGNYSVTTSILRFVPSRQKTGVKVLCKATNAANKIPKESNRKTLNVLYPPSSPQFKVNGNIINGDISFIVGKTRSIQCVSYSNPSPSTYKWSGPETNDGQTITFNPVQKNHTGLYTCEVSNTMNLSRGGSITGNNNSSVNLVVLFPPTINRCTFVYNNNSINVIDITKSLMIMEHESFTLDCVAAGNPLPNSVWNLPSLTIARNTSTPMTINTVTRYNRGNYVFYASSTLKSSYQDIRDITVNKSITVEILFPPTVKKMTSISKLEGSRLAFNCSYTVGFPTETIFLWTRDVDAQTWKKQQLSIANITKDDTGNYQCNVSNTMRPSGDSQLYTGSDVNTFYLNVLYKASITSFAIDGFTQIVTVNESDPVSSMCVVDSNPLAMITLENSRGLLKNVTSHTLYYKKETAACIDADTYTCSARNEHNGDVEPIKTIQLFVNCRPRAATVVDGNRTSGMNKTYSFIFNATAYPVPIFTWWKLAVGSWTQLESDDDYTIQSSDLQTNFTINRLNLEDFTAYKLVAENTFGTFEQKYNLNMNSTVRPGPPTDLRHRHDLTTTNSIHITWKPGRNGGLPQTFHIKYMESSTGTWSCININDTGDKMMNYTITGLTEKTQYDIIIYASNKKGSSVESPVLKAFTKENEDTITNNIVAVIGYSVGAVLGCIVLILLSTYLLCRLRSNKRNDRTKPDGSAIETTDYNSFSDTQAPYEICTVDAVYYNAGSVSNYDILKMRNRDESTYSSLVDLTSDRVVSNVYENMKLQ